MARSRQSGHPPLHGPRQSLQQAGIARECERDWLEEAGGEEILDEEGFYEEGLAAEARGKEVVDGEGLGPQSTCEEGTCEKGIREEGLGQEGIREENDVEEKRFNRQTNADREEVVFEEETGGEAGHRRPRGQGGAIRPRHGAEETVEIAFVRRGVPPHPPRESGAPSPPGKRGEKGLDGWGAAQPPLAPLNCRP